MEFIYYATLYVHVKHKLPAPRCCVSKAQHVGILQKYLNCICLVNGYNTYVFKTRVCVFWCVDSFILFVFIVTMFTYVNESVKKMVGSVNDGVLDYLV